MGLHSAAYLEGFTFSVIDTNGADMEHLTDKRDRISMITLVCRDSEEETWVFVDDGWFCYIR